LLRSSAALRRTDRPIGVLLRDPAASYQLSLIDAILPARRRVGVVMSPQGEPLKHELDAAAQRWPSRHPGRNPGPWIINVGTAADPYSLTAALQPVLRNSDALLILPDPVGTTSAAGLTLLQAAANANLPVFASSDAMVLAGALAALVPSTAQLAQQAQDLGRRLQQMGAGAPVVETPKHFAVRTNPHVARRLGLTLASDDELTNRLSPKE
jgi:putative ABC transport system substrate-binding protein